MNDENSYTVLLDNKWTLNDLHIFPHHLNEAYAFYVCLDTELASERSERIDLALRSYPWQGGWSVVHFYDLLQAQVPEGYQTDIVSIRYASPGWFEVIANWDSMEQVARTAYDIVGSLPPVVKFAAGVPVALKVLEKTTKTGERILSSYNAIQELLREGRRAKVRDQIATVALQTERLSALHKHCDELAKLLGFKRFKELLRRSRGDEELVAKLLSAQYRRLRVVADYVERGQAALPVTPPKVDE